MEMCVCDYNCMMGHFDDCLDPSVLKSFLRNELLKKDPDETISSAIGSSLIRPSLWKKKASLMILLRTL